MVDRLGWTLIHFVWEGAVVAASLGLTLLLTRRSMPALRYGLALGALALLAVLPFATFAVLAPAPESIAVGGALRLTAAQRTGFNAPPAERMPMLVAIWGVGVVLLSLRLVGTTIHLARWRRRYAVPATSADQTWLDELALRLGIKRRVALMLSDRLQVPSAWGIFRPVVVLPATLMSGLSPAQIEGILLHELAHVRRHDYLVNLLQSVVETALFYHPAVWWVSSVVRREREHLCDDVAVSALGDPMPYARALLLLEERRQAPRPALSAKGGNLMNRIARILSPKPAPVRLSPLAPSLAALSVVALALGGVLRAEAKATAQLPKKASVQKWHRPGLDVSVHGVGDSLRINAKTSSSNVIGYYRAGEGERTWARPGLNVTVRPQPQNPNVLRLDAHAGTSNVVTYYRITPQKVAPVVTTKRATVTHTEATATISKAVPSTISPAASLSTTSKIAASSPSTTSAPARITFVDPTTTTIKTVVNSSRTEMQQAQAELERAMKMDRAALDAARAEASRDQARILAQAKAATLAQIDQARSEAVAMATTDRARSLAELKVAQASVEKAVADARKRQSDFGSSSNAQRVDALSTAQAKTWEGTDAQTKAAIDAIVARSQKRTEELQKSWRERQKSDAKAMDERFRLFGKLKTGERLKTLEGQGQLFQKLQGLSDVNAFSGAPFNFQGNPTLHGLSLWNEPKIEVGNRGRVTMDVKDVSFSAVVRALARKAKLSVVIERGLYRDVSLVISDRSASDAFTILCKAANAKIRNENGVYYITPQNAPTARTLSGTSSIFASEENVAGAGGFGAAGGGGFASGSGGFGTTSGSTTGKAFGG